MQRHPVPDRVHVRRPPAPRPGRCQRPNPDLVAYGGSATANGKAKNPTPCSDVYCLATRFVMSRWSAPTARRSVVVTSSPPRHRTDRNRTHDPSASSPASSNATCVTVAAIRQQHEVGTGVGDESGKVIKLAARGEAVMHVCVEAERGILFTSSVPVAISRMEVIVPVRGSTATRSTPLSSVQTGSAHGANSRRYRPPTPAGRAGDRRRRRCGGIRRRATLSTAMSRNRPASRCTGLA